MKNKALLFWRKNYIILTLSLIILLGAFLRLYHFSDWLHFELDQSRDAKVIDLALEEGPDNLPLLGPKAAGTFLRLGPVFYYFQYLSALVFGETPGGMAMIMALFGIGAIPLFYFVIKRYFEEKLSLALTFVFSFSLFLVMYSRFSWNPNALPFFILLAFLGLLKSVDPEEKNRGRWLIIFFFSLAAATQLHFLALATLPVIVFLFFIARLPKIRWHFWLAGFAILLLFYIPPILNDIKTGGDNFGQLLEVAQGRSNKSEHSLASKLVKNYSEQALGHFLILTAKDETELPRIILMEGRPEIICDQGCRNRLFFGGVAGTFFSAGLFLLLYNFWRLRKEPGRKKDFLLLTTLWFFVVFALYTPLAYDISPRFLLTIAPLPFIFLGFLIEAGRKYIPGQWKFLAWILIIAAVFMNLGEIKERFEGMKKAPTEAVAIGPDRILKEKTRVTLEQQYQIVDYIESFYRQNQFPVYLNTDPEYRRSFMYHLDKRGMLREDWRNVMKDKKVYQNGNYFLVYPTLSNIEKDLKKYEADYTILEKKSFGTLTLFRLEAKETSINASQQEIEIEDKTDNVPGVPVRYRWEEIFNDNGEE